MGEVDNFLRTQSVTSVVDLDLVMVYLVIRVHHRMRLLVHLVHLVLFSVGTVICSPYFPRNAQLVMPATIVSVRDGASERERTLGTAPPAPHDETTSESNTRICTSVSTSINTNITTSANTLGRVSVSSSVNTTVQSSVSMNANSQTYVNTSVRTHAESHISSTNSSRDVIEID